MLTKQKCWRLRQARPLAEAALAQCVHHPSRPILSKCILSAATYADLYARARYAMHAQEDMPHRDAIRLTGAIDADLKANEHRDYRDCRDDLLVRRSSGFRFCIRGRAVCQCVSYSVLLAGYSQSMVSDGQISAVLARLKDVHARRWCDQKTWRCVCPGAGSR